jgi:TolB protein
VKRLSGIVSAVLLAAGVLATAVPASASWAGGNGLIVFQSQRDGNSEIYVMAPDGSGQTNITNSPADGEQDPDWSPDGSGSCSSGTATSG